ncbi:hypothetical protein ABIF97_007014 [Bradyrhizobium japonicum]
MSWARNLRLNNPHAKLTLSMVSLYVNGDGYCFVSIPTLSDDTEFSQQTVRNRLAWLEEIGAIVRMPQFIDQSCRRPYRGASRRSCPLLGSRQHPHGIEGVPRRRETEARAGLAASARRLGLRIAIMTE